MPNTQGMVTVQGAQTQAKTEVELLVRHVASGVQVTMKKYILLRTFRDQLSTNYTKEPVYGRMDPITTYQGTTREITLGIDLGPFQHPEEGAKAMARVSRLMQFQYPVYEKADSGLTLQRPPLVLVQFANYIRSGTGGPLLCAMNGISYSPFDKHDISSAPFNPEANHGLIVARRISVDMSLTVLHEQPMGWQAGFKAIDPNLADIQFVGGERFAKIDFDKSYPQNSRKPPIGFSTATTPANLPGAQVDEEGVINSQNAADQLKIFR